MNNFFYDLFFSLSSAFPSAMLSAIHVGNDFRLALRHDMLDTGQTKPGNYDRTTAVIRFGRKYRPLPNFAYPPGGGKAKLPITATLCAMFLSSILTVVRIFSLFAERIKVKINQALYT